MSIGSHTLIVVGVYEMCHQDYIEHISEINGIEEIGFLRYFRILNTLINALIRFLRACNRLLALKTMHSQWSLLLYSKHGGEHQQAKTCAQ